MKLTQTEIQRSREYTRGTSINNLGNLHERMRCVRKLADEHYAVIPNDLIQAICDLETEVSFYTPAQPPFGRRICPLGVGSTR